MCRERTSCRVPLSSRQDGRSDSLASWREVRRLEIIPATSIVLFGVFLAVMSVPFTLAHRLRLYS